MNNMQKWAKTMELLHDVEIPPFNPIPKEIEEKHKLHETTMQKLRKILEVLPLEEDEKDDIEDKVFVRSCATLGLYNYSLDEKGIITHKTSKGRELIRRLRCADKPVPKNYRKSLEFFIKN